MDRLSMNCSCSTGVTKLGPRLFIIGTLIAIWVPVIGWLLIPVFLLLAVIAWVTEALPDGKATYYCRSCKKAFQKESNDG